MPPPVVLTSSPIQFVFKRSGGAVIHARLSVWSDVGTPNEKRVLVLFFEDALDGLETFSRELPPANYSCVLSVFVREDLRGDYDYVHSSGGQDVAADSGDVNVNSKPGEGLANRHEYFLSVT